ncbi:MAG: phage baseplate assembly protein V [Parerythrobacter sp.]
MTQFFGKYRGKVENNRDPLFLGRIQVSVPAIYGDSTDSWAMPCVPFAGPGVGLFALPPVGASVWVEFEGGDSDYPIWAGCFWGPGEMLTISPTRHAVPVPPNANIKAFKTGDTSLTINDLPGTGGLLIKTSSGIEIAMTAQGVEVTNGQSKISLTGPQVSINDGALEVV